MLRIVQSSSVAQAKSYYSKADYYSEGQELAGHWGGKGAEQLGLVGEIKQEDFQALCDNKHPQTGEKLTPRTKSSRTVGYDFNFHVPKGVSLAYMLNRDERILDAFRLSVNETMEELEADAKTRVRMKGRNEERITANLSWGQFIHLTARPVEGIPDPHLHAHCFVFNLTHDPEERRWKAAYFRDIKRDAPYFEAAFYARFAKRLSDLGYPIARSGKQWDLAGVPKSLTKKFSRRTDQIERHAREKEITDAQAKDGLGAKTREKKTTDLSMPELRTLWRERMSPQEIEAISNLLKQHGQQVESEPERKAMQHAAEHCFERSSVVPARNVLAEALRYGVGQVTPESAKDALRTEGVIVRQWAGREMATTPHVLHEEQELIAFAKSGRQKAEPLNAEWKITRDWLNEGQQAAVRHVIQCRDTIAMIRGMAGTGKTSLMQEAVEAIEAGGHRVFAFAPSAEASRNVLRSEGFANATTVAELLLSEKLQHQAAGQVLWVDEAGLLGSRQLKRLFDVAKRIQARIILSGDWRQHGSVERGAAMRLLEQEAGIKPAIVSTIQRQSGSYRDAVAHLARGETEEGFDLLDKLGWIEEIDTADRPGRIAHEYADILESDGKASLIVSPTHAEAETIVESLRRELKRRGLLATNEKVCTRLIPRNLTVAERADPAMYEPGDVLVLHQNAPGFRKGERISIGGSPPMELLKHPSRFNVYREAALTLAAGDKIRFTANGFDKSGKHRLNNGAVFTVRGFTRGGDLKLENGWIVPRDHGFLSQGYVVTSHAAQGKTVEKVLIAESSESLPAASQEQFYVSISRARRFAKVFTDDKAALREAVTRSSERLAATELVGRAPSPELPQRRLIQRHRPTPSRPAEPPVIDRGGL